MSDQESKPCLFCRKEADVYVFDATWPYDRNIKYEYQPGCETDGCPGEWGGSSYSSDDEARKTWNTRTPDPMLEELANRLNNCLVLLENYQGQGADARMIEKSKLTLQRYRESKVQP